MLVSSPTARGSWAIRPGPLATTFKFALTGALSLGLVFGFSPTASAEDLKDARAKVRKALVQAKQEIASDKKAVAGAEDRLKASESKLDKARSELAYVEKQLAAAQAKDKLVAADLAAAKQAFDKAAQAVLQAQQDVEKQRSLVGVAVRSAYQQHTDLQNLGLVFGAETAGELSQRTQWSESLFNNSTSQLKRLEALERGLEAARTARANAEAVMTERRKVSAEQVRKVERLTNRAKQQKAELASLVAQNKKLRSQAKNELEQSKAEYRALERQEARISAKLRRSNYNVVNKGGFIKPVNAAAGSPFGMRFHPILRYWRMHWGTDFGAACGAPIRAMADGRVVSAGWTSSGFGNYTIINYGKLKGAQIASGYAHQSKVVVRAGQRVKQGQVVGYVGTTGLSTGCHLHLQVYRSGTRVNPMRYL